MLDGKPVQIFWGIFNPTNEKAEILCNLLNEKLKKIIKTEINKLIAKCYDGANNRVGVVIAYKLKWKHYINTPILFIAVESYS